MSLPHVDHQTTLSVEELIDAVLNGEKNEIEMAASKWISDEDDASLAEICDEAYDQYFETTAKDISSILGPSLFQGSLPAPEAWEWDEILGLNASFAAIAVWKKTDKHIYLELVLEENIKVVTLGAR